MHSEVLNETREFRVLLPRAYPNSETAYPIIYVLDGDSYFLSAYTAMQTLAGLSMMPEAIVVAVTSPDRTVDYSPPTMNIPAVQRKGGDQFLSHLEKELIPHIDKNYRTLPLRILLGHSHGAIFSLFALTKKADLFKWHVALDAPMHLDNFYLEHMVEQFLQNNPGHKGRLVVGWNRYNWSAESWQFVKAAKSGGFIARKLDLPDETHSSMYHAGFYYGLKELFADYQYRHREVLEFDELEKRYLEMNASYGYEIPIPIWALRYGALEHLTAADAIKARPFVEKLASDYGETNVLDDNVADWLEMLESNPPEESRSEYLSRPEPKVSELKEFIGTWSDSRRYTITVRNNQDSVQAYVDQVMPDGEVRRQLVTKVTIASDGSLELAHANGMPPLSGLIVYKLQLPKNGTIKAQQRFRVYWPRMEGRNRPQEFTLYQVEK